MINEQLLTQLKKISEEEKRILSGEKNVQKSIYTNEKDFVIDSHKMLARGKLIDVRPHTRFVHFPVHRHNYIEIIYMCCGSTTHIINGATTVRLLEGELLLFGQNTTQEILPAGTDDIAVNFIVLPEFFDRVVAMMEEENVLRDFLIHSLKQEFGTSDYFHFQAADILPVQNLVENLIWSLMNSQPNRRGINQITMGLLFLHLMNHTDQINRNDPSQYEQNLTFTVLKYIEEHYRTASLEEISSSLKIPSYYVSRTVKRHANHTFKQLLQTKRLNQSAFLLSTTTLPVEDIITLVGYDNTSYFHKIFRERFSLTPRAYRLAGASENLTSAQRINWL